MSIPRSLFAALILLISTAPAWADTMSLENGGDTFTTGSVINENQTTSGDAFVTARTVLTGGETQGDFHATGFDVAVGTNTAEDMYALGGRVTIRGTTAQDLTAAGFSVHTEASASTGGNARLMGKTLTIEGPVAGALSAMGQDIILNAPVEGDVRILAQSISFGPNAVITGTFTYGAQNEMTVPERVAPAERVVFEKTTASTAWREWDDIRPEMPILPTFASILFGFVISLMFFVIIGAVMLGFMPRRLEKMRQGIAKAPGQSLLLGVIGLSMLFGMVPISGLTIVGLPFVPIVILAIFVAWTLGYALGAYSVAMRVWTGLGGDPEAGNGMRLLVFAAAISVIALLNFIPFVGWVANYTLVLLGLGAMTHTLFQYLIGNPGAALDIDMKPIED